MGSIYLFSTSQIMSVHHAVSSIAHVNCGQCQTVLMYPYGASSVKCAICNFITNIGVCQYLLWISSCWLLKCSVKSADFRLTIFLIPDEYHKTVATHNAAPKRKFIYCPLPLCSMSKIMSSSSICSEVQCDLPLLIFLLFSCFWQPPTQSQNVTVVVENPMTVDDKGKLVSGPCISLPYTNCMSICISQ